MPIQRTEGRIVLAIWGFGSAVKRLSWCQLMEQYEWRIIHAQRLLFAGHGPDAQSGLNRIPAAEYSPAKLLGVQNRLMGLF
jgi:hypothetical protein